MVINANLFWSVLFSLSVLAILWVLFFVGAYKISQFEKDFTEYDPYAVLELDRVSCVTHGKIPC